MAPQSEPAPRRTPGDVSHDDEPLTEAEIATIERSKREIARGEYVADEDLDELLARPVT